MAAGRPVRRLIMIGAAAALLVILTATGLLVWNLRNAELAAAGTSIMKLDRVLAEHTTRLFKSTDIVLAQILDEVNAAEIADAARFETAMDHPDTYDMLRHKMSGLPPIDALFIVDSRGFSIASSRRYPEERVDVSDREYFVELRDHPQTALFISRPVANRVSGINDIFLARRVAAPDGSFLGVIVGGLTVSFFEDFYRDVSFGDGSSIGLTRADGIVLARYPQQDREIAETTAITRSFEALDGAGGPRMIRANAQRSGLPAMVAFQRTPDYPLYSYVGMTERTALADWRRQAAALAIGSAVTSFAVLLIGWLLLRQIAAREAMVRARDEANREIAARRELEMSIAQTKAVEQQLRQSQKMEAVGNLTGGVAHDFNNLLGIVIGNLELLLDATKDRGDLEELARDALEAAQRGGALTRRLLAFARRQPLQPRPADPGELVGGIVKLLRPALGERIEIDLAIAADVWPTMVDPVQLEAAITNLATNARHAMPRGGRLSISVANMRIDADFVARNPGAALGDFVAIEVADTGSGIAPEHLSRIFEPFFTTKQEGEGSGLGLSMVFGFIKQSGGYITVTSDLGVGTSFRLYLPRSEAEVVESATAASLTPRGGGELILAVDDNDGLREVLVKQLKSLGYRVIEARNAQTALDILHSGQAVDLLLTDIVMPGKMDGLDLVREVMVSHPTLRYLLTTGYADGLAQAPDALMIRSRLLTKPYRKQELARMLRAILDGG